MSYARRDSRHDKRLMLIFVLVVWWLPTLAVADEQETKFPAEGVTRLEVRLSRQNIRLMAWNDDVITVSWEGERIPVYKDGDTVRVGSRGKRGEPKFGEILVLVPEKVRIDLESVGGNIEIQGFDGRVKVETMSGDVRLAACSQGGDIKTVGGEIHVQDVKGDLSLKTVSGGIIGQNLTSTLIETKSVTGAQSLKEIRTRQLRMNTHSGALRFEGRVTAEGMVAGNTFSGPISFRLKPGDAFELSAKSRYGSVKVGEGIKLIEQADNQVKGVVGQGGASIALSSFSGAIDVRISGKGASCKWSK